MTKEQWEKLKSLIEDPNKEGFKYTDELIITRDSEYIGAWKMEIQSVPLPEDWDE